MTKTFWLSFCDTDRRAGEQFLGVCVVDVDEQDVAAVLPHVHELFPHAPPGAEWIAAAIRKTHALGCNPGGEVAMVELLPDDPNTARCPRGVLLDNDGLAAVFKSMISHH